MQKIRTVIAEDDRRIAEIQQRLITQIPEFEVTGLAHTLADALHMIEVLEPDLLLLDIQFPDGSGLDCLKSIREQALSTDVILVTAAREVETLKSALHSGVFDYIVKPLVFDRIQDSMQRYLAHHARLRSVDQLDQQTVDSLLPRGNKASPQGATEPLLPKGIDSLTLEKVRQVFVTAHLEPHNASQIGEKIGVSRTTARRYLEYLVSSGELAVDVSYGGVGRPERHYR